MSEKRKLNLQWSADVMQSMCISVNTAVPHLCVIAVNVKGGGRWIVSYQLTYGAVTHM